MRLYHRNAALSIKTLVLETEDGRKTLAHELIHVSADDVTLNIFKFIIPTAIIVTQHTDVDYFGFLFYFRYDRENDICGSFKNYEFFEVYPEYIIL